jgi:Lrp/AsnC family leucine-responsive transcriptional regulator
MGGDNMDEVDLRILELLETNGRMTHEEIGRRLNLSRPAIHQRVSRLEQAGVIRGYHADINWSKAGQGIKALVMINVKTSDFNKMMEQAATVQVPGLCIERCLRITGKWCVMLQIRAQVTDQITALHDQLLRIEGVTETFTILILQSRPI